MCTKMHFFTSIVAVNKPTPFVSVFYSVVSCEIPKGGFYDEPRDLLK